MATWADLAEQGLTADKVLAQIAERADREAEIEGLRSDLRKLCGVVARIAATHGMDWRGWRVKAGDVSVTTDPRACAFCGHGEEHHAHPGESCAHCNCPEYARPDSPEAGSRANDPDAQFVRAPFACTACGQEIAAGGSGTPSPPVASSPREPADGIGPLWKLGLDVAPVEKSDGWHAHVFVSRLRGGLPPDKRMIAHAGPCVTSEEACERVFHEWTTTLMQQMAER